MWRKLESSQMFYRCSPDDFSDYATTYHRALIGAHPYRKFPATLLFLVVGSVSVFAPLIMPCLKLLNF